MHRELRVHLLPLLGIFLFTSLIWALNHVPFYQFLFLFLGLLSGSFLLDTDHLIYWFLINPRSPDGQLAAAAAQKNDFRAIIKLFETTHQKHTSLVFHHFFFQIVLTLTSLFVFTTSASTFILGLMLALNLHLLTDEIADFYQNKTHLQRWLFAHETKQLPLHLLGYYLTIFSLISVFFFLVLVQSQI